MSEVLFKIVNLSITAGWLILAIILVRLIFRRCPKWIFCVLWALVAVRLICPVSLESGLSLIPDTKPVEQYFVKNTEGAGTQNTAFISTGTNNLIQDQSFSYPYEQTGDSVQNIPDGEYILSSKNAKALNFSDIISMIWIIGGAGMLIYAFVSYLLLRRRVATATLFNSEVSEAPGKNRPLFKDTVLCSENIASPFVLGLFRPRIYLPYNVDPKTARFIIAHERAHISRGDHLWKFLGFVILSVYWFNPLVWIAYVLLCRDIEAACDEKVVKEMETVARQAYSTALLECSLNVTHKYIAACPLAFGEVSVKSRIKNVMNYKKPVFWVIIAAAVSCAVLAVCFLTNPKTKGNAGTDNDNEKISASGSIITALQNLEEGELSENVRNLVKEDWEKYDRLDELQRMVSSHMPGFCFTYFNTWKDACEYIGITPWNPLESADWLEKANCYGDAKADAAITEHCHMDCSGKNDGTIEFAELDTGYAYDGVRVTMTDILAGSLDYGPDENADEAEARLGLALTVKENGVERPLNKEMDHDVSIIRRHTEIYDALELHFFKNDKRAYIIRITGYDGPDKVSEIFDRICEYIGLDVKYSTLQFGDSGISHTVTPLPNDRGNDIPGLDTGNETDIFITPASDDVTSSSLNISYVGEDEMIPYDTDKTGAMGGYYFIPVDGNIYRYRMSSVWQKDYTKTDKIFEFTEEAIPSSYKYTIFKLAEYPKGNMLYARRGPEGSRDEYLLEIYPAGKIADGELEKAVDSDFVIMKNGSVEYNRDKWNEFYEKTASGQPATVRIGFYYTIEKMNMTPEAYESVKEDYPSLFLRELTYDGTQYTNSPLHRNGEDYIVYEKPQYDSPAASWKYLMHYTGEPNSQSASFSAYDRYVLTNDDTVTWEDLEWGTVSSVFGDYIPFNEVYCEYTRE